MPIQKLEPVSRAVSLSDSEPSLLRSSAPEEGAWSELPEYLVDTYWWAYLHPRGIRFFERQWLVNLILWGNFRRLRDAALLDVSRQPESNVLQVACVYGDFSGKVLDHVGEGSRLDVVDVARAQLANLKSKLPSCSNLFLHRQDSTKLQFEDDSFDTVILFFLLHEQPAEAKTQTLAQALRVLKPGGRLIVVDYHSASRFNPVGYLMKPVFANLEPFAAELCASELLDWVPDSSGASLLSKQTYFGGLYQKVLLTK